MLLLELFPLPAPAPKEAEPCLESSDQATRCTSTAADYAPLPHTGTNTHRDTSGHSGVKNTDVMLCTHVHETHRESFLISLLLCMYIRIVTLVLVATTTMSTEQDSEKEKGVRVIKYSLHSVFRLYCKIIKSISCLYSMLV